MKKNVLLAIATVLVGSVSSAASLECTVTESVGQKSAAQNILVTSDNSVAVKTASVNGFITYTNGYTVLQVTESTTGTTSYALQKVGTVEGTSGLIVKLKDFGSELSINCKVVQ